MTPGDAEPARTHTEVRTEVLAYRDRLAKGEGESIAEFLAERSWLGGVLDEDDLRREVLDAVLGRLAAADAADGGPEPERFGRFELLDELGAGGMGTVHLAFDTRLGRNVAVKRIRPEMLSHMIIRERFQQEAHAVSRLDHPNLCRVHDVGEHAGVPYIVMQLIQGTTLAARLREEWDERAASETGTTRTSRDSMLGHVALVEKVARGLQHAHEHGLIHRDVKPGNIMITDEGEPVLLDFGLVRDEAGPDLTLSGAAMGTRGYMSPEQVRGTSRGIDHRTDVYSLGVVLYQMLTGRLPFPPGDSVADQGARIVAGHVKACHLVNRSIPTDLSAVVHKAMAAHPRDRYATAAELADDLARFRHLEPVRARPAGPLLKSYRWSQRNPWIATSIASLVIGLSVVIVLLRQSQDRLERLNLLGGGVILDQLENAQLVPLPAWPENLEFLRRRAADLAALEALRDRATAALVELRSQAAPYTEADRARDRATHPRAAELRELGLHRALRAAELEGLTRGDEESRRRSESRVARLREKIAWLDQEIAGLDALVSERRTISFDDLLDRVLHDTLTTVLDALESGGLERVTRDDLDWAGSVVERSVDGYAAEWQQAIAAIRDDPGYDGIELRPQVGLVPLGLDPETGLQEFWHVRSGNAPERDPDTGRLRIAGDTGMVFVLLPPGKFWMGFQNWDVDGPNYENAEDELLRPRDSPPWPASVPAFFVAKHEITVGQWQALAGATPEQMEIVEPTADRRAYPVTGVSWTGVDRLLRRHGLRLPSEVEWEYACRAGTETSFWSGNRYDNLGDVANLNDATAKKAGYTFGKVEHPLDDGHALLAPADTFRANPFGLHHIHGNALEWTSTWYDVTKDDQRVIRGGSIVHPPEGARSAYVSVHPPSYAIFYVGARAARSVR